MTETLLVTGVSGKLGRKTVDLLLEKGVAASRLIATTRDPSKLDDLAAKGVQVRAADFDDASGLPKAFEGADRVAIISTDALGVPGKRLSQHQIAVAAAKTAGVGHVIYTSMPNPVPESLIPFAGDHRGTEEAILASGMAYTILRNGWYQENLFFSLPSAFGMGQLFTSAGAGKCAHVAHDDCANALAAALMSDDVAGKTFTLTGPEALTMAELGALAAEATGKDLAVINVTDDQFAAGMKAAGVPDVYADLLVAFDANTREGFVDIVTHDVETLTGQAPKPLTAFLGESAGALTAPQ